MREAAAAVKMTFFTKAHEPVNDYMTADWVDSILVSVEIYVGKVIKPNRNTSGEFNLFNFYEYVDLMTSTGRVFVTINHYIKNLKAFNRFKIICKGGISTFR